MTEPRRTDTASRLSHDIGDVLSAIRRLIAEDSALSDARADLRRERTETRIEHRMPEQLAAGAEMLAGRHGGNAALARQMATRPFQTPPMAAPQAATPADAPEADGAMPMSAAQSAMPPVDMAQTEPAATSTPNASPVIREQPVAPAPKLRLGAAQRVQPEDAGANPFRGPRQNRLHVPWRPYQPGSAAHLDATDDEDAPAMRDFDGSRLSPQALAASLAPDGDDAFEPMAAQAPMQRRLSLVEKLGRQVTQQAQPAAAAESDADIADLGDMADDIADEGQCDPLAAGAAVHAAPVDAQPMSPPDESLAENVIAEAVAEPALTDVEDDEQAEALIRNTIRDMIQEELHGELGQRFSRNLRAMIRREIALAIDEQLDRL